jgi:hypothetical protein
LDYNSFDCVLVMPAAPNPWDYAERSGNEHAHQTALFMWANMAVQFGYFVANHKEAYTEAGWAMKHAQGDLIWQLKWLHAIKNQEKGGVIRGAMAKAEGVKPGVSDIFLPFPMSYDGAHNLALPRVTKHGFYLELKVDKNQPSNQQLEFKANMESVGYHCAIAWGWLEARQQLLEYLRIKPYDAAIYTV